MAAVNTRVVRRSNALLDYAYSQDFRYREVMANGGGLPGLVGAAGLTGGMAAGYVALSFGPSRSRRTSTCTAPASRWRSSRPSAASTSAVACRSSCGRVPFSSRATSAVCARIRACVLASAKPGSFVAGANLKQLGAVTSPEEGRRFSENGHAVLDRIAGAAGPVRARAEEHGIEPKSIVKSHADIMRSTFAA